MSACVQSSHVCQADSYLLSIIAEVQHCGRDPETRLREKFVLTIAPPVWCRVSVHSKHRTGTTGQAFRTSYSAAREEGMLSKINQISLYLVWIRQ